MKRALLAILLVTGVLAAALAHESRHSTTEVSFTDATTYTYDNYTVYPQLLALEMVFPSGEQTSEGWFKVGNSNYLSKVASWTNQTLESVIFYFPQPYNAFEGCQIVVTNSYAGEAVIRIHQRF